MKIDKFCVWVYIVIRMENLIQLNNNEKDFV